MFGIALKFYDKDLTHASAGMNAKKCLKWMLAAMVLASGLAVGLPRAWRDQAMDTGASADQFCTTAPVQARATSADRPDRHYVVEVPRETPVTGMQANTVHSIAMSDVVEFRVSSSRPGQIAVHGLLDVVPVQVDGVVTVVFRAIYSGRFPLHFHGADGSHFEIAALEVLPKSMAKAEVSTGLPAK